MPKVTSSSSRRTVEDDKENNAPTMAAYIRRNKQAEKEQDEIVDIKRPTNRAPKDRNGTSSSSSGNFGNQGKRIAPTMERDLNDVDLDPSSALSSKRARNAAVGPASAAMTSSSYSNGALNPTSLSQKLHEEPALPLRSRKKEDVLRELEEVQAQFDELRELRFTEPERMLAEWRVAAEHKGKLAEGYITALKKQLEEADRRSQQARHSNNNESNDSIIDTEAPLAASKHELYTLRRQIDDSQRREEKLKEENEKLVRQLHNVRIQSNASTSSLAFRAGIGSGKMQNGVGEERAVRRLYEDLTGLVINKVEHIDGRGGEDARRFHAIFACAGYYDLEIKLDESTSDLPSIVPGATVAGPREDLVYTPTLDEDRDAELLQSGRMPPFLKDSIRFERATAVKFLATLHKRLDRHSKR